MGGRQISIHALGSDLTQVRLTPTAEAERVRQAPGSRLSLGKRGQGRSGLDLTHESLLVLTGGTV